MNTSANGVPSVHAQTYSSFWLNPALGLLLFILVFAVFSPAIQYDFVWYDDNDFTFDNPYTSNGFSKEAWHWAWTARPAGVGYLAPVLWLSYMLDATIYGGTAAWGYHLTNILFHSLVAMLFFFLLARWTATKWPAFAAALFWAIHPLRVESVVWIAERKDVLNGLFLLLFLFAYEKFCRAHDDTPKRKLSVFGWMGFALFWLIMSMLNKPILFALPFILVFFDIWPLKRLSWKDSWRTWVSRIMEKWPVFLCVFIFAWTSLASNVNVGILDTSTMPPFWKRLLLVPANYQDYLIKLFKPWPLSVFTNTFPEFHVFSFVTSVILLLGITILAWIYRQERPNLLIGWMWFLGLLAPTIGFIWFGVADGRGDRYSYLPFLGLTFLLWPLFSCICSRKRFRYWLPMCLLAFFDFLTMCYMPIWKNPETFYVYHQKVSSKNAAVYENLIIWLGLQNRWDETDAVYEAATKFNAGILDSRMAVKRLTGFIWRDDMDAAINYFVEISSSQNEIFMESELAAYWMATKEFERAIDLYKNAYVAKISLTAREKMEWVRALWKTGKEEEFYSTLNTLKTDQSASAFYFQNVHHYVDLLVLYLHAFRDTPNKYLATVLADFAENNGPQPHIANNIAWLIAMNTHASPASLDVALTLAQQAVALLDNNPHVLATLAVVYARMGDFEKAIETTEQAIQSAKEQRDYLLISKLSSRLVLFRKGEPYTE